MNAEIRFYLDEHVNHALRNVLRRRHYDVVTVVDAGLVGQTDEAQLAYAAGAGRVLVTQDRDFLRLHGQGFAHAGIVYFPQNTPIREMIEAVLLVAGAMTAEEIRGTIQYG